MPTASWDPPHRAPGWAALGASRSADSATCCPVQACWDTWSWERPASHPQPPWGFLGQSFGVQGTGGGDRKWQGQAVGLWEWASWGSSACVPQPPVTSKQLGRGVVKKAGSRAPPHPAPQMPGTSRGGFLLRGPEVAASGCPRGAWAGRGGGKAAVPRLTGPGYGGARPGLCGLVRGRGLGGA